MRLDPRACLCFFAIVEMYALEQELGCTGGYGGPCPHLPALPHMEQPPTGKRHQASDIHKSRALSPRSVWTRQLQRVLIKASWFFPLGNHPFKEKMCLGKAEEPKFLSKIHSQPSCGTSSSKRRERQPRKGTGATQGAVYPGFGTNRLWRICTAFSFVAFVIKISPDPRLALHFTFTTSVQIVG